MFYRCRFQGGSVALSIGRGGFMGSENLLVDCLFSPGRRRNVHWNFNALSNTVIGGKFEDVIIG